MDYVISEWRGFKRYDFTLDGRRAILVEPQNPAKERKWLLKTEYFDAFPAFEVEMLKRGYYLAYIENKSRWFLKGDDDAKKLLCDHLIKEFSLNQKCMPVGMSCGGLQAIYFAAKYPENVGAMYLDAPVLNYLSCPFNVGVAENETVQEFTNHTGMTLIDLINYRNHPIDNVYKLIENRIPVFLINGTADKSVPYEENGKHLYNMYIQNNIPIRLVLKEGAGHHPHGLEDLSPLIEFTREFY